MKTYNTDMDKFIKYIADKDVYIYGIGDIFRQFIKKEVYREIHKSVAGYIDNGKTGQEIEVSDQKYIVQGIEYLKSVKHAIVLVCGTKYLDSMYKQLCEQQLDDEIECFILPLIWSVSGGNDDANIRKLIDADYGLKNKIEKKIHCFWFSGDKKPPEYQQCIDSWKRVCPEYEIIEWNAKTYDCEKNTFVKQAFEKRKWAFVSDYARLDVIYNYGGIYLDMDVELFKNFDPFLKFRAFFNFGTQCDIDLGSGFGSVKNNPFVAFLLDLYKDKEFLDQEGNILTDSFVQPALLREAFGKYGFSMNGNMQILDDMLVLPRKYYTPMDDFFLQYFVQCEETRGIHHYNAGWWEKENRDERQSHMAFIEIAKNII